MWRDATNQLFTAFRAETANALHLIGMKTHHVLNYPYMAISEFYQLLCS